MSTQNADRRKERDASRRRAFETLYEASVRREAPAPPDDPAAAALVEAVDSGYEELVSLIEPRLKAGWRFDRLTLPERLILLLGTAELVATDRGTSGVIAAWTRFADLYGEPASHRFVNAVLVNLAGARPA